MLRATAYARGRMKTLRDLQQGSDSDEEERPQEYYAGGEKSCVVLLNNESGGLLSSAKPHPSIACNSGNNQRCRGARRAVPRRTARSGAQHPERRPRVR